jgi:hypothetical protein
MSPVDFRAAPDRSRLHDSCPDQTTSPHRIPWCPLPRAPGGAIDLFAVAIRPFAATIQ